MVMRNPPAARHLRNRRSRWSEAEPHWDSQRNFRLMFHRSCPRCMWPGLAAASVRGLAPSPVSTTSTHVLLREGQSSPVVAATGWWCRPADPAAGLELVDRAADAGAEGDPVDDGVRAQHPLGALTTTSLALEYQEGQEGQADARTRWLQMTSADALTTMSLCAIRSARSGLTSPGQWMCADQRWTSSVITGISPHRLRYDPSEVLVTAPRCVPDRVVVGSNYS